MTSFTLDALLRALFHEERANVANNMRSVLDIILTDTESRVWSVMNVPTFIAHRLPKYFKAKKFLNELVIGLINDRRANKAYPDDLLSRLIGHYDLPPADQQTLQDDVLAFLLSGHDTTSHALSWTFYNLALHTRHRELLVEEIDKVLGNATPTLKNLEKLTYARQIFEEVLRLCPPVWSMSREAAEDEEIPLDDGSTIFAPAGKHYSKELQKLLGYTIHRPQVGQYEGNDPSVLLEDVDVKTLATQDLLPPIRENLVSLAQKLQDDGIKFPENVSELISMLPSAK